MPRPEETFLAAVHARFARRVERPRLRVAAALALGAVLLAAFAGFGGLSYASSAASSSITSLTGAFTAGSGQVSQSSTPAAVQYGICGIGNYVWLDKNGNGIQDDGPTNGVNGVTVQLLDATGTNVLATTVTANSPGGEPGYYLFSQIECTTYKVRVAASNFAAGQPLEGKFPTTRFAGGNPNLDSNGDATSTSEAVLLPNGVTDLSIDFGYLCPMQICPEGAGFGGNFFTSFDMNGNLVMRFEQFTNFNDNSYGANAVGWGAKDHRFQDLTGSDNAQFAITNGAGVVVLQFKLDYLTCNTSYATPSQCKTLGPDGGDGGMVKGQRAWILSFDTSLDQNLNDTGYCTAGTCIVAADGGTNLKVDSPKTTGPNSYTLLNPGAYPAGWNFNNVYEAVISKDAWGAAGFGGVTLASIHNSPAKPGATCPPGEGGEALCAGDTKLGSLTMKYTSEPCQTPLPNPQSGKATCTGTLAANTQPVRIVATNNDGKKVYFDSGTATINIGGLFDISAATAGEKALAADTLVKIYNASGTLIQTIKFHTSCSQLIAVGDKFGALEIVSGVNVPK